MVSADDLLVLASQIPDETNKRIVQHAAVLLERRDRNDLEEAHNVICDVRTNLSLLGVVEPQSLGILEALLRQERIDNYGAVGRPIDLNNAPYRRWGGSK